MRHALITSLSLVLASGLSAAQGVHPILSARERAASPNPNAPAAAPVPTKDR